MLLSTELFVVFMCVTNKDISHVTEVASSGRQRSLLRRHLRRVCQIQASDDSFFQDGRPRCYTHRAERRILGHGGRSNPRAEGYLSAKVFLRRCTRHSVLLDGLDRAMAFSRGSTKYSGRHFLSLPTRINPFNEYHDGHNPFTAIEQRIHPSWNTPALPVEALYDRRHRERGRRHRRPLLIWRSRKVVRAHDAIESGRHVPGSGISHCGDCSARVAVAPQRHGACQGGRQPRRGTLTIADR